MSPLPSKPRTYYALRKARQFLLGLDVSDLPLKPDGVFDRHGWCLLSSNEALQIHPSAKILRPGMDARTIRCRRTGVYVTVYDESALAERLRWTLAHEIGHIVLGHVLALAQLNRPLTPEEYRILEREADKFASELLSPTAVLHAMGTYDAEDIAFLCGLSREASEYRSRELILYADRPVCQERSDELEERFNRFISFGRVIFGSGVKVHAHQP